MDEELKQLAMLALRNAFWRDFSALVNEYLAAGRGLDTYLLEMQMGEMTSIYGRDTKAKKDIDLNLWTAGADEHNRYVPRDHETILQALDRKDATAVHLCGQIVFERRDGEWYFADDQHLEGETK